MDDEITITAERKFVTTDEELTMTVTGSDIDEKPIITPCEDSPDKKHHYEYASSQHAVMYHACYSCVFCGYGKCVSTMPPMIDPLTLPTDEDLNR